MFSIPRLDRKGSVSVIGALVLPLLIGMSGLVAEFGNGVLAKTQDQRVADLAAFAGAVAYNASASTTTMNSAIDNVAVLNGLPAADVTAALVTSPSGDGNKSVQVTVNTSVPLLISRVIDSNVSLPVKSVAYAEIKANAPGCIIALNASGSGITLSGSSAVTADQCAVNSNSTVTVPCSSSITTESATYDSASAPSQPCNGIQPPSGKSLSIKKALTADPLAGSSAVATATARLSTVAALTSPGAPSVTGGTAINFALTAGSTASQASADGCSAALSGSTWTVTCPSGGTYHFGSITDGGSVTVKFNTAGSAATTYDFSGPIAVSSSSNFTFGPGLYNIAQGVTVTSSSNVTFGAGTFNIGRGANACTDGGTYSLCVASSTSLTFGGPSVFDISAGIYTGSSATVTLGAGSTNSFDVGASSNGNALSTFSSSKTVFADATGGSSVFQLVGAVNAGSSSCVTFGNAAEHDINGPIVTNASSVTTLGSGVYTVHGYLDLEASSGGGGCGTTAGQAGTGVTFVTDGANTPTSGSCASLAICVLSSSGDSLVAPTTGATAGIAVIGPVSSGNTAGASFGASSNGTFSGIFYMPNGAVTVDSSASLSSGANACLELIGAQITLQSSSTVSSTCIGSSSTSSSVVLVQ
ncbi:MAG TPA: pilus assembly protein TadG-related protein [Caulobacteraceae bacterium]|nr:pilus assembly protein TadG-related protein [Caulobacteraceae bacterium]